MTPKEKLVTVLEGTGLEEIKTELYKHRIEKMLVVDANFHLRGLVTFRDIEKAKTTRWRQGQPGPPARRRGGRYRRRHR